MSTMNAMNPYLKEYKKNQVETATPEQILILLYDGAIQYLNKAAICIEEKNSSELQTNLFACEKIIIEFMNTLDMELGGDVARNLYRLYEYFYRTLISVGITQNMDKLQEVLRHLKNLRDTWQKAIIIANAEKDAKLKDELSKDNKVDSVSLSSDENNESEYYIDDDEGDEGELV